MTTKAVFNTELLQIADAVSREKSIDKNIIIEAMESSITIAARKKYGHDRNIRSEIDRSSGEIRIFRESDIVADDYEPPVPTEEEKEQALEAGEELPVHHIIKISEAKLKDEKAEIGGILREPLPPIDLGRVAAQTAKQVIIQKIREAEREREFEDYKNRTGEVVNGTVKRAEFGHVILDLGGAEAIITKDQTIRGENFRINDRTRAYIKEVRKEKKGPQIFLSRSAPEFMSQLFTMEVPEIYDNIIEIKGAAREPGSRAKIAVFSTDPSIDPVGSCVGVRGARVQAVSNELQGEKIDIVKWSSDLATYLINALSPAEISKVVIDEDNNRIEAIVAEDQLSLAIGRRGQNVRLASELLGWNIDILTEEAEIARRTEDTNKLTAIFTESLNIEEIIGQLLVAEGFTSIEQIAYIELAELASIEGFDEDIAGELQARAKEYLDQQAKASQETLKKLKVSQELQDLEGLTPEILITLGENKIITLEDFAGLARDEFTEIVPESGLDTETIDRIIMKARESWFSDQEDDTKTATNES